MALSQTSVTLIEIQDSLIDSINRVIVNFNQNKYEYNIAP